MRAGPAVRLRVFGTPLSFVIEFEIETLHSHLVNSVLVPYFFLLVLRLLAGQVP